MTQPQPISLPSRDSSLSLPNAELAVTLLGPSAAMGHLWTQVRRLAPHLRTVLLTGEPDCGQEAVARLFLDLSPHNHRQFVTLSAAEAELRLLRATGVVTFPADVLLFLPDAHLLSRPAQDALLRLIRMRRARPFTVVAAFYGDLRSLVSTGRFCPELAEVLGAVRLTLPPLRQRSEDLPMLISQLLESYSAAANRAVPQLTEAFLRAAMQHRWAGNLRELARCLAWLCARTENTILHSEDLEQALAIRTRTAPVETTPVRMVTLDTVIQEHLQAVLVACHGNKLRAAEVLGISRSTLYRMLDAPCTEQPSALYLAS